MNSNGQWKGNVSGGEIVGAPDPMGGLPYPSSVTSNGKSAGALVGGNAQHAVGIVAIDHTWPYFIHVPELWNWTETGGFIAQR